jgi:hypothetical protein
VIEMKTLIAEVAPLQEVRTEKARLSNKFLVCHIHSHLVLTQSKNLQTLNFKARTCQDVADNNSDVFMC